MDDRNIFAYTAPGADWPDYLSINRKDEIIVVTVRGNRGGDLAEMTLPYDQLDSLIRALRGARPANIYGSGDKTAFRHIPRVTDAPAFPVPTSHLEKAQMKIKRKPR